MWKETSSLVAAAIFSMSLLSACKSQQAAKKTDQMTGRFAPDWAGEADRSAPTPIGLETASLLI